MALGLSAADAHRALSERLAAGNSGFGAERSEPAERRIVLVERDPYAADLAEYFLRTEGYDVHVARAVPEAERLISEQGIDLAIVDLMIGGGAGLRLCERLGNTLRVLAVSALDQRERAMAAGADAFIRKPFEPLTLVSAARDLVGTSAMVREAQRVPSE
jgi:DNA-binding response OmpR family regulator